MDNRISNTHLLTLSGWGNISCSPTRIYRPEFLSECASIIAENKRSTIARGCGRSYGDQAVNGNNNTMWMTRCNRFVAFDSVKKILICESGVTIHDIQTYFLPKKIGLKISPGTAWVTVGGAIANDVHGKNHDRVGSFSKQVLWFDLLIANGTVLRCSRQENSTVFYATIGGMGLTGIILQVALALQAQSPFVFVENTATATLSDMLALLKKQREKSTYSVGWLNLMSPGQETPGIFSTAEPDDHHDPVDAIPSSTTNIFAKMGRYFLTDYAVNVYNQFYFYKNRKSKINNISLFSYLYPLDCVSHWNRWYGKKGFYQFQCVIPDAHADVGISDIISVVKKSPIPCYLAVIKTLGSEGEGMMSFPLRGFTVALDFPNRNGVVNVLHELHRMTILYGGRVYLAKDQCAESTAIAAMYPNLSVFQSVLDEIDPYYQFESDLSRRLQIRKQS